MPDPIKVAAYAKESGERHHVPEHWLGHPVLGANLSRTPTVASPTPDETWKVPALRKHAEANGVDLAGASSKAEILAAINNPFPAAGDDTTKE